MFKISNIQPLKYAKFQTKTKSLQCIQNAAARLMYNPPTFFQVTRLLRDLHWLPVAACIRFKMMVLVFKAPTPNVCSCIFVSLHFNHSSYAL